VGPLTLTLFAKFSTALLEDCREHRLVHLVLTYRHVVVSLENRIVCGGFISEECPLMIVSLHEFIGNSLLAIGGITAKAEVLLHPFNIRHITTTLNFLLLVFPGCMLIPIPLDAP
jgi:hypothetical protein